jgi:hypothetical protein
MGRWYGVAAQDPLLRSRFGAPAHPILRSRVSGGVFGPPEVRSRLPERRNQPPMLARRALVFLALVVTVLVACSSSAQPGLDVCADASADPGPERCLSVCRPERGPQRGAQRAASATPSGSPSGSPAASGGGAETVLQLAAANIAYDQTDLTAPANVAVPDRLHQQRRGDPPQRLDPPGLADRHGGLQGRDLHRRGHPDLRRPGAPRRDVQLRLLGPPQHGRVRSRSSSAGAAAVGCTDERERLLRRFVRPERPGPAACRGAARGRGERARSCSWTGPSSTPAAGDSRPTAARSAPPTAGPGRSWGRAGRSRRDLARAGARHGTPARPASAASDAARALSPRPSTGSVATA